MNHNDTRTSKADSGILTARQAPGGAVHRKAQEFGGSPLSLVPARSSSQVTGFSLAWSRGWGYRQPDCTGCGQRCSQHADTLPPPRG